MNDKYKLMREKAERVSKEVLGLPFVEAVGVVAREEMACRILRVDGQPCMITADVRMDRLGFTLEHDTVTEVQCG